MPTVTPPTYTKQVMVMLEPEISGEVYAWAAKRKCSGSAVMRDLIAAGLAAKREQWAAEVGVPADAEIRRLRAEHRRQGLAQTERRQRDDADRRKSAPGAA